MNIQIQSTQLLLKNVSRWLLLILVAVSLTGCAGDGGFFSSKRPRPRPEPAFFNGKDLTGWSGAKEYWSVEDGAIVGQSDKPVPRNEFLWSDIEVRDFYFSVDVKIEPNNRNAGIQFRSRRADPSGQAYGYQADIGRGVWGRLYHEHGRGKLDWTDRGEKAVKPGEWNHYEILAVGSRIWTAINGTLSVAFFEPEGEKSGYISLQLHGGPPQKVSYRIKELIHDPKVRLAGLNEKQLNAALQPAYEQAAGAVQRKPQDVAPQAVGNELIGYWPVDGSVQSEGRDLLQGKLMGGASFVDSEIAGKALQLDGQDAYVTVPRQPVMNVGQGDFTIAAWIRPNQLRQAAIVCLGGYGWRHGWLFDMHPDGSVRLETAKGGNRANGTVQTPRVLKPNTWVHVAASVQRGRAGAVTRLFVNGYVSATGNVQPNDLDNPEANFCIGRIENGENFFPGLIDEVRYYRRALGEKEIQQLVEPGRQFASKPEPRARSDVPELVPFRRFGEAPAEAPVQGRFENGRFVLNKGDVVVFTGGANMVREQYDGLTEAALARRFARRKPRFRNMAWEGDTVYEQWRDRRFGTWADQLSWAKVDVLFAGFGQMESLQGQAKLEDFVTAYRELLDQFAQRTERIVLLSPIPFERGPNAASPDLSVRNGEVRLYVDAIRDLAARSGYLFVDLFSPLRKWQERNPNKRLTDDGLHLTHQGLGEVTWIIMRGLRLKPAEIESLHRLCAEIVEKNRLWFECWRPTNWSFAYGDTVTQPFGNPAGGRPFLREEYAEFKPLIAAADERIQRLARGKAVSDERPNPPSEPPSQAQVLTPEEQLATFDVLDGYEVNLFAGEADGVIKPVDMCWDERGRLWIACSPGYPQILPGAEPKDFIIVCEDTDNDGRVDRSFRFAENLAMPMGIELGHGGVYVCQNHQLLHLRDSDGDGKADQQKVILEGFGTGDTHQTISTPIWSPAGALWFTQGNHAVSRVETPWGIERLDRSGIWRYWPRRMRLDGFFNRNAAGGNLRTVAFDAFGQPFFNDAPGDKGSYIVPGMIRTQRSRSYRNPYSLFDRAGKNVGVTFIDTEHLPDDMQGVAVVGGYYVNTIQLHRMKSDGAGYQTTPLPDLVRSSFTGFRVIDVSIGPDGAIYGLDWYNPVIGHYQASYRDPKRDKSHGRIWRVKAQGRPLVRQPKLHEMSPAELIEQLRSREGWTRYQAKRLLFGQPTDEVIAAADTWVANLEANDAEYERWLFEVIGVYESHEVVRPGLLQKLLAAKDAAYRAYGARVIGSWAARLPDPLELLAPRVLDPEPRVRLEAVVACSYVALPDAVEVATRVLETGKDRWISYALNQTVHALHPYWLPALAEGKLSFGGDHERLAYVLRSYGQKASLPQVRKALRSGAFDGVLRQNLLVTLVGIGDEDDLHLALDQGGENIAILESLLNVSRNRGLRPSGDPAPVLARLLGSTDAKVQAAAVQLSGAWRTRSLGGQIALLASDERVPLNVRVAAIEAMPLTMGPGAVAGLVQLAISKEWAVRVAAIGTLLPLEPVRSAQAAAGSMVRAEGESEMMQLLGPFLSYEGAGDKLAEAVRSADVEEEVAKLGLQALSKIGRDDAALADALRRSAGLPAEVYKYSQGLVAGLVEDTQETGDAVRGAKVFRQPELACLGCHRVGAEGGTLGPELAAISRGMTPELIVESVLWPKRQVKEGFVLTRVTTKGGQQLQGYKRNETSSELVLTEPGGSAVTRVLKNEIKQRHDDGSIMPDHVAATLKRPELVDLLAYLMQLGK